MVGRSSFIKDLAQVANGAASALSGVREEIDNMIRQRMERSLNARGLVTREEFDALRTRHEAMVARVVTLEAMLNTSESASKTKSASAKKPAKKPAKKATAVKKSPAAAKKSAR
jgi:BMFP domain-containing protein YqiC